MNRRDFTAALLYTVCATIARPSSAATPAWPERPVRVLTPFPAGTGADIAARLYAERLSARWGKPVIVENRPGADGILAVSAVVNAHDGHTLLFTNGGPLTANLFNHDKLPYDPDRDLLPISTGVDVTVALSVPAALKINSLSDFIAYVKSHSGQLNWGSTPGVLDYVIPAFFQRAGLRIEHVAYKDIAPALQDLAEGRIHLYVSALATQLGYVKAHKITAIAVTNRKRSNLLADVPTVSELGFEDLTVEGFVAFFAPRDLPQAVVEGIGGDIRAVAADPSFGDRLTPSGFVVRTTTSDELKKTVEQERAKIKAAIGAGIARR
jgi:tripartite-type tricarboxylate transporter receptor subunit TctC